MSLLRAYIITVEDIPRLSTMAGVFPPPECELATEAEFADRGDVMTVLLQYLEFAGVVPRSVSEQTCPEEWRALDGPSCIEEVVLTGAEVREMLVCLDGYTNVFSFVLGCEVDRFCTPKVCRNLQALLHTFGVRRTGRS